MTVGVVYRVSGGAVLVSDGRVTHGGEVVSDTAQKCFLCGPVGVIVAGEIGPLWRRLQERPPRTFKAFREAVDAESLSVEWLAYDPRSRSIWLSDVRISAQFAALGSGSSLALGALEVLPAPTSLVEAKRTAEKAVRAACRRHTECGGKIRSLMVPKQ